MCRDEITEHREGRSPTAKALDRAIRKLRVQTKALETIRAELDLPEHLAEIVGDALAKDAGRSRAANSQEPSLVTGRQVHPAATKDEAVAVCHNVLWLANNMHNYGSEGWREFFMACVRDAKRVVGYEAEVSQARPK